MAKDRRKRGKKLDYPELVKFLKKTTRRRPGEAEAEAFRALYPRPRKRK